MNFRPKNDEWKEHNLEEHNSDDESYYDDNINYDEFGEEDFEEDEIPSKRKMVLFRITGFFVLIFFLTLILTNFIRIFTLPPMDFVKESNELLDDPEISNLQKSVVQVKVDGGGIPGISEGSSRGSGFNIKEDGFVVTNRHIVENGDIITVLFEDDGVYRVEETLIPSTNLDLAFLKLEDAEGLPVANMASDLNLDVDDEVIIIGNPMGFSRVAKEGRLAGLVEVGNYGPLLEVYAPIYPGSSGSPVFNKQGQVVGIIYAARQIGEDEVIGIAFNTKEIIEVMKEEEIEMLDNFSTRN